MLVHVNMVERPKLFPQIDCDFDDGHKLRLPEHSLIEAVLNRAWSDATKKNRTEQHYLRDACFWFHDDSLEPFSFLWVMQSLGYSITVVKMFRERVPLYYDSNPATPKQRHIPIHIVPAKQK